MMRRVSLPAQKRHVDRWGLFYMGGGCLSMMDDGWWMVDVPGRSDGGVTRRRRRRRRARPDQQRTTELVVALGFDSVAPLLLRCSCSCGRSSCCNNLPARRSLGARPALLGRSLPFRVTRERVTITLKKIDILKNPSLPAVHSNTNQQIHPPNSTPPTALLSRSHPPQPPPSFLHASAAHRSKPWIVRHSTSGSYPSSPPPPYCPHNFPPKCAIPSRNAILPAPSTSIPSLDSPFTLPSPRTFSPATNRYCPILLHDGAHFPP